ncbi:ABC transporter substrate-binding protein [Nonomuraea rubra]|uniref:Peptide/nickel transport system substrate-binding protein n=2 Tax=Nonomuraea rubra TaxID=46180 RepID=A0A7X0U3D5_9ACTN|nr:ABC transporter substrate-binding protein [Nonomuraea rubra]MBB6553379.1 peptide/nickel transport system substrate-binding protein [Nonomuraea rubra]
MADRIDPQRFSRRDLIRLGSGALLVTATLTACTSEGSPGAAQASKSAAPPANRPLESPMLAEQVKAGKLPPLAGRLPEVADRLVVDGPEGLGTYGGTYRGGCLGEGDDPWLERLIGYEPMLRVDPTMKTSMPGAFKEIAANADGTEYTIHMRKGMRWSDGQPFTADDVMFAIEDVYLNDEVTATGPPPLLLANGKPAKAEKVDDLTVKITFAEPKGDFLDNCRGAIWWSVNFGFFPRHYLKDFHPKYNKDYKKDMKERGFGEFLPYWEDRIKWWNNPERPTLHAWIITDPLNTGDRVVAERNPYYWKVDSGGAQLPYIDKMEFAIIQEAEVMVLQAVDGKFDFHARHINSDANKPVLAEGRQKGGYRFTKVEPTSMNRMIISLNLCHKDKDLRDVFRNKDFRIGLSHAIDRQNIINTAYQRQGEPWQAAPHRNSEFFDEQMAKQYTEFDVNLANQHLDKAGLTKKDDKGFRLLPSGERLRFSLDLTTLFPEWANAAELVRQNWEAVGVEMKVNPIERTLFYDRKAVANNQHDANIWAGDGGYRVEIEEARWWFPNGDESNYATPWGNYFQTRGEGDDAQKPPAETLKQMELYWQMGREPDQAKRKELFRQILAIAKEQFYVIGIVLPTDGYAIASKKLKNVPESYPDAFLHLAPGPANVPTWYFEA